jgi:cytochrome c oxidase subunit 4
MAHHHNDSHHHTGHVVPVAVFSKVLGALLVLTIITVAAAQIDMGKWNIVGALGIASVKASLVIWFFMHGAYENKIIWTYVIIPFILLAIMISGVFTDDPFRAKPQPLKSGGETTEAPAPAASHHGSH